MRSNLEPEYLATLEAYAIEQARSNGLLALERFRRGAIGVEYKGRDRRDPVTEVDREVEDRFRAATAAHYPEHTVLGEERQAGEGTSPFVWVIDPVDGTTNFASGLPVFAVSIGLLCEGRPVVGAIYVAQPGKPEGVVVHARLGGGCFRNGHRLHAFDEPALHPSRPVALPAAFWRRFSLGPALRWQPIEVRTLGSIAYEITLIAGGTLQFGAYRAPKIWDVAAGVLLVQEAGGAVFHWNEGRWNGFQRFEPPEPKRRGAATTLRDWSGAVILGGAPIATLVAGSLRPRLGLQARLWPIAWRLFGG